MVEKSTERKNLLEDLVMMEDYVNDLFSFSPLSLCYVSPKGVILEVNPAFEKMTGYSAYNIVGEHLDIVIKEKESEDLIKETLQKESLHIKEAKIKDKQGKEIFVRIFTNIRKNNKEETVGIFIAFFDLTDIKVAEARLEEANSVLEIKVRARTRELRELTKTLDSQVKEKNKELLDKIEELEGFNKLAIGRELKMIELKEKNRELLESLNTKEQ